MRSLTCVASSAKSPEPIAYVYSIVPFSRGTAAISSDDSLCLYRRQSAKLSAEVVIRNTHQGVTCLKGFDEAAGLCFTAGRDGAVRGWDMRTGKVGIEVTHDAPILSLETSKKRNLLVAGTELHHHQAGVVAWDIRATKQPQWQYMESHSDDITELRFHPSQTALLISGSTDGLVNLYDTALQDEEDALLQTINHGSSIHRAGFLGDSEVFALGHDETLSLHQLTRPPDDIEVQSSTVMGDVREMLSCEYVVDVLDRGIEGAVLATGRHDEGQLDLIPLKRQTQWCFDTAAKTRLPAAHSGEVVRSIYIDEENTVFSAGEDGSIKAWSAGDVDQASQATGVVGKAPASKESRSRHSRFMPY